MSANVSGPSPWDQARVYEYYKIQRAYIEHEDNLINHRNTWGTTIQSFLIATFGFSVQKIFEVAEKILSHSDAAASVLLAKFILIFMLFLLPLCIVGLMTAVSQKRSVRAAYDAIDAVRRNYDCVAKTNDFERTYSLVPITGGGDRHLQNHDFNISGKMPKIFMYFWLIVGSLCLLTLLVAGFVSFGQLRV
jgi:hypothetical protein